MNDRDLPALRAAIEAYRRADAECARLTTPDDHGSGERTARLSALSAWEAARARALDAIEGITGARDLGVARRMLSD